MNLYEQEVLKTLSYFEKMGLEKIYLDFDQDFLIEHPDFNVQDLKAALHSLVKKKKIKKTKDSQGEAVVYVRRYPQRKMFRRVKDLFKRYLWKI